MWYLSSSDLMNFFLDANQLFECPRIFPGGSMVKDPPAMWEPQVRTLGWEDPLEKGMAPHSSILARGIPWTEELRVLQTMGLQRAGHDWMTNTFTFWINDLLVRSIDLKFIINDTVWVVIEDQFQHSWLNKKKSEKKFIAQLKNVTMMSNVKVLF